VITTADGLLLTVAIGSLAFAPSELQVARVPVEDAAGFIPAGVDLVDLFVLHPILSRLDPPAAVAFPDDLGLPEGTPVLFHSLDYDLGQLVVVAAGVVGQDGRPRTEDGQGIPELTWLGLSVEDEE
jgi:hypothetical protein